MRERQILYATNPAPPKPAATARGAAKAAIPPPMIPAVSAVRKFLFIPKYPPSSLFLLAFSAVCLKKLIIWSHPSGFSARRASIIMSCHFTISAFAILMADISAFCACCSKSSAPTRPLRPSSRVRKYSTFNSFSEDI